MNVTKDQVIASFASLKLLGDARAMVSDRAKAATCLGSDGPG